MRAASVCAGMLALAWGLAAGADEQAFRYRWTPGDVWHATQTIDRVTTMGDVTDGDRGVARIEYRVNPATKPDHVTLDAVMLSQTTTAGASPFDFSVIHFRAVIDSRGRLAAAHYEIGDVEPPELPGIEKDPVAYRLMLRNVADAWLPAVYWFPQLPDAPLAVGAAFEREQSQPVGGTDPGVTMRMVSTHTLTLREIEGDRASFDLSVDSRVDASTAESSIASSRDADGTLVFDLGLGMPVRQETRAEHRATFSGAQGLGGDGRSSAHTVIVIEMAPANRPASR